MNKSEIIQQFKQFNKLGFDNKLPEVPILLKNGSDEYKPDAKGMCHRDNITGKIKIILYTTTKIIYYKTRTTLYLLMNYSNSSTQMAW